MKENERHQELTKDEISLLLYLETLVVDNEGKIDSRRMNDVDWQNMKLWKEENFINFGRIKFEDIRGYEIHWCELTEEAIDLAHDLRKDRINRGILNRKFRKV